MATVERGQLRFVEPFDDRKHGRVNEADVRVGVAVAQITNARVVGWGEIGDRVGARFDVGKQGYQGARIEPLMDPVVDLDEDRRRNHEGFIGRLDQCAACRVIGVGPVKGRVQRSGVEDQRHERGSGRSFAVRRAVSVVPESPIPRLLGFGA